MKWIINLAGKHLWSIAILCLFTVALTLADVVQALTMANFLDFAAAGDRAGFLRWFGVYFSLIFFQLVGGVVRSLLQQSVSNSLHNKVRLRFYRTVLTREYAALREKKSGELMQLISSDTSVVVSTVIGLPMEVCSLLAQLIGASLCLTLLQGKLALEILRHGVFLMHAAIIDVDGEGYAFLAHSGTGKTTQTRLWLEYFGSRARVINGDKPLIRLCGDGSFVAYGTPWCGKEGMGCNASVPLKALYLLERAPEPSCERASQEYSVDRLFHQLLMPQQAQQMMLLLDMVDKLVETIPCYRLRCNMKQKSVITAYEAAAHNH